MGLGAWVRQVGEVLGRAHALFADPPALGSDPARGAGTGLRGAAAGIRAAEARMSGSAGQFAAGYTSFAGTAGPALDRLGGVDATLGSQLSGAESDTHAGRATSGSVLTAAASDTAVLSPYSGTPAGEKLLLTQLRARLRQQQQVISAYRLRDARMAAALRALAYPRPQGGFAMPSAPGAAAGAPSGGGGVGTAPLGGLFRAPPAQLVSARHRQAPQLPRVPGGPGERAVAAALTRRGDRYVWGAKGPTEFDCSGLTQWAWQQAGVNLGSDTYSQIAEGLNVPPGQVRAGDLIFPTGSYDSRGPGHVQLAVSATEVIHAPHTGDVVRLAPMPGSYVARRPLP